MSELIAPTGRVHWAGTGLSTGSGLRLVAETAAETVVWGRTREKAEGCLDRVGLTGRATARAFSLEALRDDLRPGDLVVSMLPATEHPGLLELCLRQDAHFACSSYLSGSIAELAPRAAAKGLVVLTDAGLDPGIDHLFAHDLVARARAATDGHGPVSVEFLSYCGSNPAEPNDFRYRFAWAPRGVLTALLTPARYITDGEVRLSERPWEALREHHVGGERFEVYPNRDSLPFVDLYAFPTHWTPSSFIRGTMRLDGWHDAWKPVFAELPGAGQDRITELAAELAARYPTTAEDRDRVVMVVTLRARAEDGVTWSGEYTLDVTGTAVETATTFLVSTGLACGIADVLAGGLGPGLHRTVSDPPAIQRWYRYLGDHGVRWETRW